MKIKVILTIEDTDNDADDLYDAEEYLEEIIDQLQINHARLDVTIENYFIEKGEE